jgi:hypothetical protein
MAVCTDQALIDELVRRGYVVIKKSVLDLMNPTEKKKKFLSDKDDCEWLRNEYDEV